MVARRMRVFWVKAREVGITSNIVGTHEAFFVNQSAWLCLSTALQSSSQVQTSEHNSKSSAHVVHHSPLADDSNSGWLHCSIRAPFFWFCQYFSDSIIYCFILPQKSHTIPPSSTSRAYVNQKHWTCVICHPIFFQFISSTLFSLRGEPRKWSYIFHLPPYGADEQGGKRHFVSSLSIWYKVLSPKINNTPFPNKCKTIFQVFSSPRFFGLNQKSLFFGNVREERVARREIKAEKHRLPATADLDYHKCRNDSSRQGASLPRGEAEIKRRNLFIFMGSWQIDLIWISNSVAWLCSLPFQFI